VAITAIALSWQQCQNLTKLRASKFPDSNSMMERKISTFHLFGFLNHENQVLTMYTGLA
jgi:hypothetical protein